MMLPLPEDINGKVVQFSSFKKNILVQYTKLKFSTFILKNCSNSFLFLSCRVHLKTDQCNVMICASQPKCRVCKL